MHKSPFWLKTPFCKLSIYTHLKHIWQLLTIKYSILNQKSCLEARKLIQKFWLYNPLFSKIINVHCIYFVPLFVFQVIYGFSSILISGKSLMFCSSEGCKGHSLGVLDLFWCLKYIIPKNIIRNITAIIKNDMVTVDPEEAFFAFVLIFCFDWTAVVFPVVETKVISTSFVVVVNVVSSFFEFLKIWWILTCWF